MPINLMNGRWLESSQCGATMIQKGLRFALRALQWGSSGLTILIVTSCAATPSIHLATNSPVAEPGQSSRLSTGGGSIGHHQKASSLTHLPLTEQPRALIDRFFPDPGVLIDTPAFANKTRFTSQQDLLDFVDVLKLRTENLHVLDLGYSQQGRRIPMMVFSTADSGAAQDLIETGKPTVWVHAQLHGDEPAAGEGALALAGALAADLSYVLERINVVIVPRVNVDGSASFVRRSADQRDLNRDSVRLEVQESQMLRRRNMLYEPAVTVDAHEFYAARRSLRRIRGNHGYLESHDLMILGPENPNVEPSIKSITNELFVSNVIRDVEQHKLRIHPYFTVRVQQAEESGRGDRLDLSSGSSVARIGRNFHGLINQASILLESRGQGIGRQSFRRRVWSQLVAMRSIVETSYQESAQIKQAISDAKAKVTALGAVIGDKDPLIVRGRRSQALAYEVSYINARTNQAEMLKTRYRQFKPLVRVLERERPYAYILTPNAAKAAKHLQLFGVHVLPFNEIGSLPVEAFRVVQSRVDQRSYEGVYRKRTKIKVEDLNLLVPAGSSIIYMSQPLGNLVAELLEPEASDSLVTFDVIKATPDEFLPVYRYMDPLGI